jgi:DNA-directed RNA polymerase subunit RPC12/RpoP
VRLEALILNYNQIINHLEFNHAHLSGYSKIILAVGARLLPFGKEQDTISNVQFEHDCHLSHRGVVYAIKTAIKQGFISRVYVCGHCGQLLSDSYADIVIGKCPSCRKHLYKNILQRFELSPRGTSWISQYVVCILIDPVIVEPTPSACTFAQRAARILGRPSDWLSLAKWIDKEQPQICDLELALAVAYREYEAHGKSIIYSVSGIIQHWYRFVLDAKEHPPIPEKQTHYAETNAINCLKSILRDLPKANEKDHVWAVGFVWAMYQDNPGCSKEMDRLTRLAGLEPRSLRKYDPVKDMINAVERWHCVS